MYQEYITSECLLGGNYREKQPHQYLTDTFNINKGDILLDVGCAEALLSLHYIDTVAKVLLFENDPIWIEPLKATFEAYMDKVVIIDRFVGEEDNATTITLETALNLHKIANSHLFIKLDIEGSEYAALSGSKSFLASCKDTRIACCTYHRHEDAKKISNLLHEMNYNYEFSDGYMVFLLDDNFQYPYYRHGVIRAWRT